ncbi:MAG: hypothetical protein IPH52_18750 [Leptospiraceae bacterium]|nr:hypothetical protein [Leptospiraceae bacterium]
MPINGITRQSTLKIIESTIYKPKEFELSYDKLFPIEQFNPIGKHTSMIFFLNKEQRQ